MVDHLLCRMAQHRPLIDRKAEALESLHHVILRLSRHGAHLAPCISKEMQTPLCRNGRVKLAQRTGGSIARIGKHLIARLQLALIQGRKIGMAHIDFATHFANFREIAFQSFRHFLNRAHIRGDIFAFRSIAARGSLHKLTAHITKRTRQAINLWFSGKGNCLATRLQITTDRFHKALDILILKDVLQRQHRHHMLHFCEFLRRCCTHFLRDGGAQIGESLLNRLKPAAQRIIISI